MIFRQSLSYIASLSLFLALSITSSLAFAFSNECSHSHAFLVLGNGTVYDARHGYQWQICPFGSKWKTDGYLGRCEGQAETKTWQEAQKLAKENRFLGFSDWQIPPLEGLKEIPTKNCKNPATPPEVFLRAAKDDETLYWSSTHVQGESKAYAVDFMSGEVKSVTTYNYGFVWGYAPFRLVRKVGPEIAALDMPTLAPYLAIFKTMAPRQIPWRVLPEYGKFAPLTAEEIAIVSSVDHVYSTDRKIDIYLAALLHHHLVKNAPTFTKTLINKPILASPVKLSKGEFETSAEFSTRELAEARRVQGFNEQRSQEYQKAQDQFQSELDATLLAIKTYEENARTPENIGNLLDQFLPKLRYALWGMLALSDITYDADKEVFSFSFSNAASKPHITSRGRVDSLPVKRENAPQFKSQLQSRLLTPLFTYEWPSNVYKDFRLELSTDAILNNSVNWGEVPNWVEKTEKSHPLYAILSHKDFLHNPQAALKQIRFEYTQEKSLSSNPCLGAKVPNPNPLREESTEFYGNCQDGKAINGIILWKQANQASELSCLINGELSDFAWLFNLKSDKFLKCTQFLERIPNYCQINLDGNAWTGQCESGRAHGIGLYSWSEGAGSIGITNERVLNVQASNGKIAGYGKLYAINKCGMLGCTGGKGLKSMGLFQEKNLVLRCGNGPLGCASASAAQAKYEQAKKLADSLRCDEAYKLDTQAQADDEQSHTSQEKSNGAHIDYAYCVKTKQFADLKMAKDPRAIYIGAGEFERDGRVDEAEKLFATIQQRFPKTAWASKANDSLLAIKNKKERASIQSAINANNRQQCEAQRATCFAACPAYRSVSSQENGLIVNGDHFDCKRRCEAISCN